MNPQKLLGLYAKFAGKKIADVSAADVLTALRTMGHAVPEGVVDLISAEMSKEEPGKDLMVWAKAKLEDGTVARWLAGDDHDGVLMMRCVHCGQPNTVRLT